ncbi:spore germination protein [Aureibacillus halotolerans]|uniref:GerA spore germination protein n=1 Tax=Aureibacillus halotolerans TaxID=1508390 RepID=A0A4R6TZ61_9BACI|nr:spore germination protein [Aureibacillus halotolerans]TDQ36084.1 GerA spore germination protein [Aureibacillus halotolerans]
MGWNWLKRKKEDPIETIPDLIADLNQSHDFKHYVMPTKKNSVLLSYSKPLVDAKVLHKTLFPQIISCDFSSIEELHKLLPLEEMEVTSDPDQAEKKLMNGFVAIQMSKKDKQCLLVPAGSARARQVATAEVEFSVLGPKEAFVESLDTNLNLVRKRLPIKQLRVDELTIGRLSKSRVAVLSMDGITNEENVSMAKERLKNIDFDQINDSSYLAQMLSDNQNSIFPQFIDTERPDRVSSVLAEGKVVILLDGSPTALLAPTTLLEYFSAFEDYFLNWIVASAFRIIRLFSVSFSILATPLYVAVLTYHYEMIPRDLMPALITTRREVPFPPIIEALFLELTIELLREAGARLPTKVGQTIGIVGGIVIGTASVDAGLTSNVLLIIVALAALSSFTTPVYKMSNTIRLIRFPLLLTAQIWGLVGIAASIIFILAHLLRLKSLGRPYLEPVFPLRLVDFKDSFIRLPFTKQTKRPVQMQTSETVRFTPKKKKKSPDIDETD